MNIGPLLPENYTDIHEGIVELLGTARAASVRTLNALMTATYWEIGRRIVDSEQAGQQRAEYGEALIQRLAADLTPRFGRGFGWRNLMQMRAFFIAWPPGKILQTPSAKSVALPELAKQFPLPWSAYVRLISVKNPEARVFYEAEALRAGWSVRQLDRQISSLFYERIALSKNKAAMLERPKPPSQAMSLARKRRSRIRLSSSSSISRMNTRSQIWRSR
ncbi:DUF1016 N-terminal domain-containing protein [Edaphobacter sp. HDX4]|uniref:DUF1016 N-terminal domain-containing protein n=1 Tax=Edaphobacter sp. HDX4 TaxID=2794064 RepID=UPI002FE5F54D